MMSLFRRRRALVGALLVTSGLLAPGRSAAQSPVPLSRSTSSDLGVGDANADVVFTPLTPCRLIDTRVAGGAFAADETRSYDLIGPANYSSLGGNALGCNVPATTSPAGSGTFGNTVRALVLSFTATATSGNGDLRAWPTNQGVPLAAVLTYGPAMYALTNGVAVATCDAAVASGNPCPSGDLNIRADSAATHLVVDVLGYYAPQRAVLASNRTQFGVFTIDFVAGAALEQYTASFSFSPPLAVAPTPEIVFKNFPPTPNCPGTVSNPQAVPGYLCLYESNTLNVYQYCVTHQLGTWFCYSADPMGAALKVSANGPGRTLSVGVWAVTAP